MAKTVAVIFGILYLLAYGTMFYFDSSEYRSLDKVCATYVVDKIEGSTETFHIENRNEPCFFFFKNILPIAFIVGLFPFVALASLSNMGCGMGGECNPQAVQFIIYAVAIIANTLFYAAIGYGLGKLTSRIFQRRV